MSSGLGGGAFITVRLANGTAAFWDARETAPSAATRDMFAGLPANASLFGGLAVAVPGELQGLEAAWRRFGSRPWAELVRPAADLARSGFAAHPYLVQTLAGATLERVLVSARLGAGAPHGRRRRPPPRAPRLTPRRRRRRSSCVRRSSFPRPAARAGACRTSASAAAAGPRSPTRSTRVSEGTRMRCLCVGVSTPRGRAHCSAAAADRRNALSARARTAALQSLRRAPPTSRAPP